MAGKRKVPFDPRAFLVSAGVGRVIFRYNKHQVLYSQGGPADAVFYIQKGKIKLTVVSDQGKEAVVAVLDPDEFLGQGCLVGQLLYMATATAMSETEVTRIEKSAIIEILHEEPAFSEMFVSHLLLRTIRVEEDLVDQLFNSSEKRLARSSIQCATESRKGQAARNQREQE